MLSYSLPRVIYCIFEEKKNVRKGHLCSAARRSPRCTWQRDDNPVTILAIVAGKEKNIVPLILQGQFLLYRFLFVLLVAGGIVGWWKTLWPHNKKAWGLIPRPLYVEFICSPWVFSGFLHMLKSTGDSRLHLGESEWCVL